MPPKLQQLLHAISTETNELEEYADTTYPDDDEYQSAEAERHDLFLRTRIDALREVKWMIENGNYSFEAAADALGTNLLRWL